MYRVPHSLKLHALVLCTLAGYCEPAQAAPSDFGEPSRAVRPTGRAGSDKEPAVPPAEEASPADTSGAREDGPEGPPDLFPEGEVLEYAVRGRALLIFSPSGKATMAIRSREKREGRDVARIELRMRTTGYAARFFPLDYHAVSVVDVGDGAGGGTVRFRFSKKEKKKTELEEFTRLPGGKAMESFRRRRSGKEERRTTEVEGPVQDVVSFFFHMRRMKLELGKLEDATVFSGHKVCPIRLGVDGLEEFGVPKVGTFWALKLHPSSAIPGLFSDDGDATIWVEETTHVMLRMRVVGDKGSATMTLVKAEKSPLLEAPGALRPRSRKSSRGAK